jgi:hypothetical protein
VSDYVLVADYRKSGTSKLHVKRRVHVASDKVFVVKNLPTKELKSAHAKRLQLFQDKELNGSTEFA